MTLCILRLVSFKIFLDEAAQPRDARIPAGAAEGVHRQGQIFHKPDLRG